MIRSVLALLFTSLVIGCNNKNTIYFFSVDKTKCITVISEDDKRYIINGKHGEIPDSNYVKLHIKDRNSISDNFYVCWGENQFEWEVVVENSVILESKLDSNRFIFNTELPTDDRGIPTQIKFSKENCATYLFYLERLSPNKGAIVEYK
jgi:hypothetical protein